MSRQLARTLVLTVALAFAAGRAAAAQTPRASPALVVFITVDQMRADYFVRFGPQLKGGLKRLHDGGAFFVHGFQDHAITETAPGHASTMSGRFPVHTGISRNATGVTAPDSPLIAANDTGASPARFAGTTLTDWLRAARPDARVLSVSRKDRGAILPIGRAKTPVFWYARSNGILTTSRYYADTLPTWVERFNARKIPQSYAGKTWSLLLDGSAYPEPDDVPFEHGGTGRTFPHTLAADATMAREFVEYPWMDQLTLDFALQGVREMGLGAGDRTDLLAVSLSTTDAVGHRYGPDSRELHDQILRLDRSLGTFLDSLIAMRGSHSLLVALTSDHGVAPFQALKSSLYPNHGAQRASVEVVWRAFQARLATAGVRQGDVTFELEGVFSIEEPEAVRRAGLNPDSLAVAFAREMRRVNGVARVDLMANLARADTIKDPIARRWLHMFEPGGRVRAVVTLTPYSTRESWTNAASHGQPYDYDANVPVLFWGAGVKPGVYPDVVRVVDMAPTLAELIGVTPLERLDGHILRRAIK